ncbi:Gfo/Idh/MocA family oxidoreductase [Cohnella ginsengisoli]|uniref:Gfo/Idh/MocA family oxidoreductase n=1 Tax=Cohnella ginsengisoli TaxID=425004 RepID=A0A9X4KEM0_9BACL|nr:Gfo/Idh/MocA family oxidoreductase [Cohnella ginsengisoli]MDG0790555.1 Gfo/Idh/MocA family oxidoreductase [Cohnella ginsengisoli]
MRIGLVDLDTSHPESFVPIIRSLGHEVIGVYDEGGGKSPPGYAEKFASDHGIGRVFKSLEEMAGQVDLAFIHSCDWDIHAARAEPFVRAGKAVFIDKPLAGNVRDLLRFREWAKRGAVISGGSALRYAQEVQEWRSRSALPESFIYALAGCANDEFYYGIHAFTMLHGLLGPGIQSVRHLGNSGQDQYEMLWSDGRRGIVSIGATENSHPFYATMITQAGAEFITADSSRLYRTLLEAVLPYFSGEAPSPVQLDTVIETELAAIAARLSKARGGQPVELLSLAPDTTGYDGAAFARTYREQKILSQ